MNTSLFLAPALLAAVAVASPAADASYGHRDFYPSPARPVGFRGDGNGWFPGATPVDGWFEGTPVERQNVKEENGKKKTTAWWDFADDRSSNIVWKTEMPSWANTQPIVVGDRVFTYGEPDLVVCVDAKSGTVLWTRCLNAWVAAGVEPAKAETARQLYLIREALYRVIELQYHFGTCGRYLPAEQLRPMLEVFVAKEWPAIQSALKKADPHGNYDDAGRKFIDLIQAGITNHVDGKGAWDYGKKCNVILGAIGKRMQAVSGVKVPDDLPWGNMVGWCMSSPVSDGRYVYAALGQGQTACLDLDGNIVWQTFFEQKSVSTHHVLSPLLAGGILVDMHGSGTLVGLNARTGERVWEAPTAASVKSTKSGYYVANHRVVNLGGIDYIVTSQCNIIRAKDGAVVGEVPYGDAYGGGAPIAGRGNLILKNACGDGWSQPFKAFTLAAAGADAVKASLLWESKAGGGYDSRVVLPEAVFLCVRNAGVLDAKTGAVKADAQSWGGDFRLVAGHTLISSPGGNNNGLGSAWSSRRADGRAVLPYTTVDISDPFAPEVLSRRNVLGGVNDPRSPVEPYLPNLWKERQFFNAKGGRPAHFAHTDTCIFPSGNRLFLRSVSHLYCIGDPAVPYDWNPASRTRP